MTEPTRFVPSTDDVDVALHDLGGEGPVLVFVHATGFHGHCYLPVAEVLADRYHSYAVDLRGHGDSRIPDGLSMVWRGMGEDLAAAVRALDAGTVYGVGHSMGGASIVLAALDDPSLFRAAWLFEPIVPPTVMQPPSGENSLVESARRRREVFDSFDAVFERYSSRPPFNAVDPAALRAYVDYGFEPLDDGTVRLKCRGATEARVFENSMNGAYERLGSLQLPTAVAQSGDGGFPAQLAPGAAARMPHGTLLTFGDLTHFGPFQDPAGCAASIDEFLQGHR